MTAARAKWETQFAAGFSVFGFHRIAGVRAEPQNSTPGTTQRRADGTETSPVFPLIAVTFAVSAQGVEEKGGKGSGLFDFAPPLQRRRN